MVLFAVAGLLYYLATYPVTSRLRGLTASTGQAGRYQLRSAAVMLSPLAIWLVLRGFMNSLHGPAQLVIVALMVSYLVAVIALGPRLLRAARLTRASPTG